MSLEFSIVLVDIKILTIWAGFDSGQNICAMDKSFCSVYECVLSSLVCQYLLAGSHVSVIWLP